MCQNYTLQFSEAEVTANANHEERPVIQPKVKLPVDEGIGYAEVINAGKSKYNEDQTSIFQG